jgi:hypothetical protein
MCSPSVDTQSKPINLARSQRESYQFVIQALTVFILVLALFISSNDKGVVSAVTDVGTKSFKPKLKTTPKRGKFIGDSFDGRDLYRAYKEIESNYHNIAFAENTQHLWRILVNKDDIEVSLMDHQDDPSCPYVRLKVEIDVPVEDCWEFLSLSNWDKTMPKMDPFYEGVELHGEYWAGKVNMILARKRTNRILTFAKRDFVFVSVTDEPLDDGTWVSGTVSVVTPKIPRSKDYIRAFQDSIAFYKPITPTKTQITIVCRIDLNDSASKGSGGWIPMWLYVKTVGISGARSVINMRTVLVEARKQLELKKREKRRKQTKKFGMFTAPWKKSTH